MGSPLRYWPDTDERADTTTESRASAELTTPVVLAGGSAPISTADPTRAFRVLIGLITLLGLVSARADDRTDNRLIVGDSRDPAELARRLDELKTYVEGLEAARRDSWLANERSAELRTLVGNVLADADTRAGLLSDGIQAGYDDGFFIASADGRFLLEISGQLQQRLVWNRLKDDDENDTLWGFEVRRAKIKLEGHVLGPDLEYSIGTAFNRSTGIMRLESYQIRFRLDDEWVLSLGRTRPQLLREEAVSSKRQLAAERSLVARKFNQSRVDGVKLHYQTDVVRADMGFQDASEGLFEDDRWRVSARAELLLAGEWKRLKDFTSFPDEGVTIAVGAAVFYQYEDLTDSTLNDTDLFRWSTDISIELGGANLFASYVANHVSEDDRDSLDEFGAVVQGGVFFTDHWELFARYEWGDADGEAPYLSVFTIGLNRYIREHALKFTFDVGYGLNEVDGFWSSDGAGWRRDESDEDGQVVVRTQFQMLF